MKCNCSAVDIDADERIWSVIWILRKYFGVVAKDFCAFCAERWGFGSGFDFQLGLGIQKFERIGENRHGVASTQKMEQVFGFYEIIVHVMQIDGIDVPKIAIIARNSEWQVLGNSEVCGELRKNLVLWSFLCGLMQRDGTLF